MLQKLTAKVCKNIRKLAASLAQFFLSKLLQVFAAFIKFYFTCADPLIDNSVEW